MQPTVQNFSYIGNWGGRVFDALHSSVENHHFIRLTKGGLQLVARVSLAALSALEAFVFFILSRGAYFISRKLCSDLTAHAKASFRAILNNAYGRKTENEVKKSFSSNLKNQLFSGLRGTKDFVYKNQTVIIVGAAVLTIAVLYFYNMYPKTISDSNSINPEAEFNSDHNEIFVGEKIFSKFFTQNPELRVQDVDESGFDSKSIYCVFMSFVMVGCFYKCFNREKLNNDGWERIQNTNTPQLENNYTSNHGGSDDGWERIQNTNTPQLENNYTSNNGGSDNDFVILENRPYGEAVGNGQPQKQLKTSETLYNGSKYVAQTCVKGVREGVSLLSSPKAMENYYSFTETAVDSEKKVSKALWDSSMWLLGSGMNVVNKIKIPEVSLWSGSVQNKNVKLTANNNFQSVPGDFSKKKNELSRTIELEGLEKKLEEEKELKEAIVKEMENLELDEKLDPQKKAKKKQDMEDEIATIEDTTTVLEDKIENLKIDNELDRL